MALRVFKTVVSHKLNGFLNKEMKREKIYLRLKVRSGRIWGLFITGPRV